jgi:hypothetical protein
MINIAWTKIIPSLVKFEFKVKFTEAYIRISNCSVNGRTVFVNIELYPDILHDEKRKIKPKLTPVEIIMGQV